MDAATWLASNADVRSPSSRFACLEGCGFCCTYPPEVTPEGWRGLAETTGLKDIGVDDNGTLFLPLQGGCGACVLLEDRRCTAYDQRPKHCRLFPFHVYFGRTVEVYANRVCPGLDAANEDTRPLGQAVAGAVATVKVDELVHKADEARRVHAQFERKCREAGVWADVDSARTTLAGRATTTKRGWRAALEAFTSERDELLPTMVLPDGLAWRTWRLEGETFVRLRYEEDGTLTEEGRVAAPARPLQPSDAGRAVLERLSGYECFVGAAFDLVDASGYALPVAEAVGTLQDEVAAAIAVREHLLRAEGLAVDERWVAATYEPDFYDLPSIGGWL